MLSGHVSLFNGGSIYVLTPTSPEAIEWCELHLPDDAQRWGATGYVVEPRYLSDILQGMERDLSN